MAKNKNNQMKNKAQQKTTNSTQNTQNQGGMGQQGQGCSNKDGGEGCGC